MPVEVIEGKASWRPVCGSVYTAEFLRNAADELDAANVELAAAQVQEVFRSDYVTVYRRVDGKEAVVAFDHTERWPWVWFASDDSGSEQNRADAETAARESLMGGV